MNQYTYQLQILFANKKFRYFLSFLTGLIIVGVYFRLQTPASVPLTQAPEPLIPQQNPDANQTYSINWGSVTFPDIKTANTYQISSPLNLETITQMANSLGFNAANQINTNSDHDFIYVYADRSFTANLPLGPVSYSDSTLPTTRGFSKADPKNEALLAVSTLLNLSPNDLQASLPQFMIQSASNPISQTDNYSTANLVKYSIHQIVDSYLIATLTQSSATINVILDNQYRIKQLEIYSPISTINPVSKTLLTPDQVKSIADSSASLLPIGSKIDIVSAINNLEHINFTVTHVSLVYYPQTSTNELLPAYRLDGTLLVSGAPQAASLIVPATAN